MKPIAARRQPVALCPVNAASSVQAGDIVQLVQLIARHVQRKRQEAHRAAA